MEFTEVIKNRYSCKKYSNTPVEDAKIEEILMAGRYAPTAKNLQEQHIIVVRSEEGLAKIDACTPCRYNAPVVLVVAFDKDNVYTYPGNQYNSGKEDATIVATHMMLAAANAGLDSCWINNFNPDVLHDALDLPDHEEIAMLLDLGYKASDTKPLPNHYKRKDLKETVTYM